MQKKVEIFTLTLLLIFVFYCAISIGISWDFEMEVNRGNERLKYLFFQSSFENYKLAVSRVGEEFYPGFYTTLVSFIAKMFPKEYEFETYKSPIVLVLIDWIIPDLYYVAQIQKGAHLSCNPW